MSDTTGGRVRRLREQVAFHKRKAEFYRRRGERFRDERDEARERVATLEEDVVLEAEACDNQSAQLLEIAETIGVVPGVAVVPGVKALQDRLVTLEGFVQTITDAPLNLHAATLYEWVCELHDQSRALLDASYDQEGTDHE